jgi:hypothetical protein
MPGLKKVLMLGGRMSSEKPRLWDGLIRLRKSLKAPSRPAGPQVSTVMSCLALTRISCAVSSTHEGIPIEISFWCLDQ